MISREMAFAESLQRIRRIAREQGNCISEEQVKEEFSDLEFNDAQLQMVYDYLEKHKVGIGEPADLDAGLTEEERNYLQNYLDGLEALPVYSDGEKRAHTISTMAGDRLAAQRLTESYLKDVVDIAKLYSGQGILLEDLIGEGNVALTMGVEMLVAGAGRLESSEKRTGEDGMPEEGKPTGGCRAATAEGMKATASTNPAEGWISGEAGHIAGKPDEVERMLVRGVMDAMEALIQENAQQEKKDRKVADRVNKVADRARELAEELHRKVTPEELVRETGMSMKSVQDAMRMSGFQIEDIAYAKDSL